MLKPPAGSFYAQTRLAENHRLLPVEEHPPLDVVAHGAGQRLAFYVAPDRRQLVDAHPVGHAGDFLFDDRAFVELEVT